MEHDIFIPTLRSFENNNTFSGSEQALRFLLTPVPENNNIQVKIWHGIFCLEKSTVEEETQFEMTEEGIAEMKKYLESHVEP